MKGGRYKKLSNVDEDPDVQLISEERNSVSLTLVGFLLLFAFVACMFFSTSAQSLPASVSIRVDEKNSPVIEKKQKNNITKYKDYYFTEDESRFLNCPAFIKGDKDAIALYVNDGRMKFDKERVFDLPMDCDSIRERVYGDMPPFKPLKRPIALVRTIYTTYELQETLFSISYHPDSVFCYVMDSKSTDKLKSSMRVMSKCFENVVVMEKEYNFDSEGHGQDTAHFDCLEQILGRKWDHAVILQNHDLIIKSPYQLSDISESLNYTSIMGFDLGMRDRYNRTADWTPAGIKLFKNETGVPDEILHRKLKVRKSLNEVILSKIFVKSIFDKLNIENIMKLFNEKKFYGVDEMMVPTLYENYLGLEGQMESDCKKYQDDILTRLTHWDYSGPYSGYHELCQSKWKRHSICVLGVEYLKELAESKMVIANKPLPTFDFGTIICTREMIKKNVTGATPDTNWLSSFPQFREMQLKANGTYDKTKFDC